MIRISKKFIQEIKLADQPAYRLAQKAGVDPATLSGLIHGSRKVWPNDRRVLAVGRVLGLAPEDCFEKDEEGKTLLTKK